MAMAGMVGKPVCIDLNTLKALRGKFDISCVEINLNQLVVG